MKCPSCGSEMRQMFLQHSLFCPNDCDRKKAGPTETKEYFVPFGTTGYRPEPELFDGFHAWSCWDAPLLARKVDSGEAFACTIFTLAEVDWMDDEGGGEYYGMGRLGHPLSFQELKKICDRYPTR